MTLIEWVVTIVAGPVLVLALAAAGRGLIRAHKNTVRLDGVEEDMNKLEDIPERIRAMEQKLLDKDKHDTEAARRNDNDHKRISAEIQALKTDLIREFHVANGG